MYPFRILMVKQNNSVMMRVVYQDKSINPYEDYYEDATNKIKIASSATPQWYIGFGETILFLRGGTTSADHMIDKTFGDEVERAIRIANKLNQDLKLTL